MTEAPPPVPPAPSGGKTNGLAIASLVMGILALLCLGALAGIPGVICGHMALGRIKTSGEGGQGLAVAGLIMGYIGIAWSIIALLLMAFGIFAGVTEMEMQTGPGM